MNDTLNVAVAVWQSRGLDPLAWFALGDSVEEGGGDAGPYRWAAVMASRAAGRLRGPLFALSVQPLERPRFVGMVATGLAGQWCIEPASRQFWPVVLARTALITRTQRAVVAELAGRCGVFNSSPGDAVAMPPLVLPPLAALMMGGCPTPESLAALVSPWYARRLGSTRLRVACERAVAT